LRFDATAHPPSREELSQLLKRFAYAARTGTLGQLSRREWAKAIWGIWDSVDPLSKLDQFWPQFEIFLQAHDRRTYLKRLILTYLRGFDPQDPDIERAASLIRNFLRLQEQSDWLWTKRHSALHLFQPSVAARSVATFLLRANRPLDAALEEAGCGGVATGGGMERAAFEDALAILQKRLTAAEASEQGVLVRRVLEWAAGARGLRLPTLRVKLAEALLLPWLDRQPDAEVQKEILRFVLKHYRDPRLDRGGWVGIGDATQQVVRRWLTEASLEQFISVVTRVAKGTHWRYRKAFWMSYFERDLIDEAWVLFGREASWQARQAFREATGFGKIDGGLSNHCVLLLKIGDLTIADWSHDGKCRIWRASNKQAPKLYLPSYSTGTLQSAANFEQAHRGSDRHNWQESIANYIHKATGAWVTKADRIPEGQ
jgi:hypothetical protein